MKKIRIGVICPSEIALRRFMPALMQCEEAEYAGVAVARGNEWYGAEGEDLSKITETELKKAEEFKNNWGGEIFGSYDELIESDKTDAVYLPLPPALHFKWGKRVLESGKHLFVEKPSTTSAADTGALVELADKYNLAIHENYMFMFHKQLDELDEIVRSGSIGEVRLYNISFGFPMRERNDFRYSKRLGGGALLDCGGYTVKLAGRMLGDSARIVYSNLNYTDGFAVDMYGSAAMINDSGVTAQISFGMDNSYKCSMEIWGSSGCAAANRIFTAPAGYEPELSIKKDNDIKTIKLSADDTFLKSIRSFIECIRNEQARAEAFRQIVMQAERVDKIKELSGCAG